MITLPDCVTRGEVARLIPVTADSNKEQRAASILLAAFWVVHEFQKTKIPKKYLKNVELYHWSWMYALTQATLLLEQEGVESEDQQFVLEEVQRYLSHDSSGVSNFDRMNPEWKDVVGHVKSGASLGKNSGLKFLSAPCADAERPPLKDECNTLLGTQAGNRALR